MAQTLLDNHVYTMHLSNINESNQVLSAEDIYNDSGVLLVRKNSVIDKKAAAQIAKHKLKKSLSTSVILDKLLDERAIYAALQSFLNKHQYLAPITEAGELSRKLQLGCLYCKQFPLLMQQLTVMQTNLPELFMKSVTGAWFAVAIANQLKYNVKQINQTFVAALIRDVGMIYIDPQLFNSLSEKNSDYFKIIQSHVVISKLVLDDISELPDRVKEAVFEHHERCDGAGYPKAKQLGQLSQSGQVVAMSDAVQAIMHNRFKGTLQNIANLEGFLALNMTTYSEEVYQAMMRLLRISKCRAVSLISIGDFSGFIDRLVVINQQYLAVCDSLLKVLPNFQGGQLRKEESLLSNFIERIIKMQARTGIPSAEYARWMKYVKANEMIEVYAEIEMIGTMFEELNWQFNQIKRYIAALWQLPTTPDKLRASLENAMTILNQLK